ncbi:hypothetical protein BH24ACT3_BH24ACT3_10610 [soil metagenome]
MTAPQPSPASRRRLLDGRTVAIAVVVALLAAAVTALVLDGVGGDDDGDSTTPRAERDLDEGPETGELAGRDITGEPAPAVTFTRFEGGEASLADYRGAPVVVNFFATWCTPCIREMPGFEQVHQRRDEITFLGVNTQDSLEDGRALAERTGVTYDLARDPDGTVLEAFQPIGMPTTVLVRADGTIAEVHTGELSPTELDALIDTVVP